MGGSEQCPVSSPPWMTKDACNPITDMESYLSQLLRSFTISFLLSFSFLFSVSFSSFTPFVLSLPLPPSFSICLSLSLSLSLSFLLSVSVFLSPSVWVVYILFSLSFFVSASLSL